MLNTENMDPLDKQAQMIAQKVRHYLLTTIGQTPDLANDEEFYRAFCLAFREEIMVNWAATHRTLQKKGIRKLYYLSMEYMPGRLLGNNVTNISATNLVGRILHLLQRDFTQVAQMEPDIGVGNGGLGRLASCFLDSLATLQYPAMGYGMRYQYGIFEQELLCGVQVERPDRWLLTQNPWEFRQDSHAVPVHFCGKPIPHTNQHGEEVFDLIDYEEVRALPYDLPIIGYSEKENFSVLTLRLWSTKESPHNFQLQRYNAGEIGQASENTSLTNVLYPNDNHEIGKRIRLKQEFLLVSASVQDIIHQYKKVYSDFESFGDVVRIQINDTHPALVIPELMHLLTKDHQLSWEKAWEMTQTCCAYTNHTVLKEALEEWNAHQLTHLLPRHYAIIQRLNKTFCQAIRQKFPAEQKRVSRMSIIEKGQVRMAHLAIFGSRNTNGVAQLHTDILKTSLFKDFYEMYPKKFVNVTNGVTQRRWLLHCNPLLASFLDKRIGKGWITDFKQLSRIADYASDPETQKEFLDIKQKNKKRLLHMVQKDMRLSHGQGETFNKLRFLDTDALFDVHIKRIHEYKRQLMNALHLLMLYFEIKKDPKSTPIKRFAIFGGKAAPGYQAAKNIIRFIYCLSRKINQDPDIEEKLKVLYIENYNVSRAEIIIPGTDLSEQISTAGMEASGTGNMKFAINGALTIATDDGANVEMRENITEAWWPFMFGSSAKENLEKQKTQGYSPHDMYTTHPQIQEALDALKDRSLVKNDAEHEALLSIYHSLLKGSPGTQPDRFFVLNDLMSYYTVQKKVAKLYQNPLKWAEFALHNMAGMGAFSADTSIKNYAQKIWGLKTCPPSLQDLSSIRKEYNEHSRWKIGH